MKHLFRTFSQGDVRRPATPACIGIAAALALTTGLAFAIQDSDLRLDSTGDLYAVCSVPEIAAEYPVTRHTCRAFIEGVAQYHDLISKGRMKRLYCMPAGSTVDDAMRAFTAWASTKAGDTKLMGEEPAVGLVRALAAAYPCKG